MYFRASDISVVNSMMSQIAFDFKWNLVPEIISAYRYIFAVILAGYVIHWFPVRYKDILKAGFIRMPLPAKGLVIAIVSVLLYQFISAGVQPFIYFQF
jgi:hypothetical protein